MRDGICHAACRAGTEPGRNRGGDEGVNLNEQTCYHRHKSVPVPRTIIKRHTAFCHATAPATRNCMILNCLPHAESSAHPPGAANRRFGSSVDHPAGISKQPWPITHSLFRNPDGNLASPQLRRGPMRREWIAGGGIARLHPALEPLHPLSGTAVGKRLRAHPALALLLDLVVAYRRSGL